MIVLYVLGYFNRSKQNSYAALIRLNSTSILFSVSTTMHAVYLKKILLLNVDKSLHPSDASEFHFW